MAHKNGSGELCRGVLATRRGVNRRLERIDEMVDLALRQNKTGARLLVPVHRTLRSWLDRTKRCGVTILTTRTGKSFRED
jgi:hypothetical protein